MIELSALSTLQPVGPALDIRMACARTDNVRVEFLRCVSGSTIRWNMTSPEMSLMWVHDRCSNVQITFLGETYGKLAQERSNCWFFPQGISAHGEVTSEGAYDCAAISVDPGFLPSPARDVLTEPLAGFISGQISRDLVELGEELQEPDVYLPLITEGSAMRAIAHAARFASRPQQSQAASKSGLAPWQLRRAKELFQTNISEIILLRHAAEACRLSVYHFARSFKVSTGITPHRWIMRMRLEKAEELLERSSMPLVQVACACGFADQSHLTRAFVQATGTTPGLWRRKHQLGDLE